MRSSIKISKTSIAKRSPARPAKEKMVSDKDSPAKNFTAGMKNKIWHNWLTEENYFVNP